MSTKHAAPKLTESDADGPTLEERVQILEKAAQQHGWDLTGSTDPIDPLP